MDNSQITMASLSIKIRMRYLKTKMRMMMVIIWEKVRGGSDSSDGDVSLDDENAWKCFMRLLEPLITCDPILIFL